MPKIFCTNPLDDYATQQLSPFGEIVVSKDLTEASLCEGIEGAIALVVRGPAQINAKVLSYAPGLKVIGRTGVGYDTIDVATATKMGVPVVYTPGVGARAVAEAALMYMLALCKLITQWDAHLKAGNWDSRYQLQPGDLDGATLGIVGLGQIGQMTAQLAQPFNMTTVAHDPGVSPAKAAELGIELLGIDELLARSDFVCLHCPLMPSTKGLINRERLAKIKHGAYLVNLARGGVVESLDVLHEALVSGRLGGVGMDVFDPAPPDTSHPIFKLNNCLTSPHSMGMTHAAMARIFRSMSDDMVAVFRGETPKFPINPETLKKPANETATAA